MTETFEEQRTKFQAEILVLEAGGQAMRAERGDALAAGDESRVAVLGLDIAGNDARLAACRDALAAVGRQDQAAAAVAQQRVYDQRKMELYLIYAEEMHLRSLERQANASWVTSDKTLVPYKDGGEKGSEARTSRNVLNMAGQPLESPSYAMSRGEVEPAELEKESVRFSDRAETIRQELEGNNHDN